MTRFFRLKAWLGGGAVVIGLVGIAIDVRWLVWIAVALLSGAFLLRFGEGTPPPS